MTDTPKMHEALAEYRRLISQIRSACTQQCDEIAELRGKLADLTAEATNLRQENAGLKERLRNTVACIRKQRIKINELEGRGQQENGDGATTFKSPKRHGSPSKAQRAVPAKRRLEDAVSPESGDECFISSASQNRPPSPAADQERAAGGQERHLEDIGLLARMKTELNDDAVPLTNGHSVESCITYSIPSQVAATANGTSGLQSASVTEQSQRQSEAAAQNSSGPASAGKPPTSLIETKKSEVRVVSDALSPQVLDQIKHAFIDLPLTQAPAEFAKRLCEIADTKVSPRNVLATSTAKYLKCLPCCDSTKVIWDILLSERLGDASELHDHFVLMQMGACNAHVDHVPFPRHVLQQLRKMLNESVSSVKQQQHNGADSSTDLQVFESQADAVAESIRDAVYDHNLCEHWLIFVASESIQLRECTDDGDFRVSKVDLQTQNSQLNVCMFHAV